MNNLSRNSVRWLFLTAFGCCAVSAILEIAAIFRAEQDWNSLLSISGSLTVVVYIAFLILGITFLFLYFLDSSLLKQIENRFEHLNRMRWLLVGAIILSVVWFYLYSPWQGVLTGPWLQFILALGLTLWIAIMISPHRPLYNGWEEILFALWLFLFPRVILELRALSAEAFFYRIAVLVGYFLVLILAYCLFGSIHSKFLDTLIRFRNRIGWLRWLVVAVILCGPLLWYSLAGAKTYVTNPNIRFSFLLIELTFVSALIWKDNSQLISLKTVLIGAFALALISALTSEMMTVINYPFSIGWSEGNSFYVYSLIFGQRLYDSSTTIAVGSPGRYGLWGLPFLFPGLPISADRFWRVVLLTTLPLLVGWVLTRKTNNKYLRLGIMLGIALFFTVEAPLHPEFMLAALLVFAFMFDSSLITRGISLAIASLYVGFSRFTWVPAIAGWAILIDLILYYPHRKGSFIHRLIPTFTLAILGFFPGIAVTYRSFISYGIGSSLTSQQPLLWYRLFPNSTLPLGILLSVLLYSGPFLVVFIWWIASGRWRLDWLQLLAISFGLAGFLIAGLIVSMKIGGGADLHNLDMYLMTLLLITVLGFYAVMQAGTFRWPLGIQIVIALAILTPLYGFTPFPHNSAYNSILDLPQPQDSQKALVDIQSEVLQANQQGLVLFIDQRQLLTFDYIGRIPFVPDYEKKYMMDQAMGNNAAYFHKYYEDLASKRFSLIVTEVLRTRRATGAFSEENNDWVDWVSKPTLCFYQPLATYEDINVQLLVPRPDISACQKYLK
jgi:hypothetical protein